MNVIKIEDGLIYSVDAGDKKATTRLGLKTKYTLGPVEFINTSGVTYHNDDLSIHKIESIAFCDLSEELAQKEGYSDLIEFKIALNRIYGHIDDYATMTVIHWEQVG